MRASLSKGHVITPFFEYIFKAVLLFVLKYKVNKIIYFVTFKS